MSSSIGLLVVILATASICVATRDPVTFLPGNAYLQYYKWTAPNYGRVEFSFKTSKPNATLLYISGMGHHVHLSLLEGKIKCSAQLSSTNLMQHIGLQYWNDDQWHKVLLTHKLGRIQVKVDQKESRNEQITLTDKNVFLLETAFSPLYIGGVPMTEEVNSTITSFEGCIREVKVANFTLYSFRARYVSPVHGNNTNAGCNGPCELNSDVCKENEKCAANWSSGETICICPSTENTCRNNVTRGPFNLNGSSYLCQPTQSTLVPYIPSYLSVRMEAPIPFDGIVFSTHEYSQQLYSTVMYIQNYKLFFSFLNGGLEVSTTDMNIVLSSDKSYLISVIKENPWIIITVSSDEYSVKKVIDLTGKLIEPQKELLCIGGGIIGLESYKGTISGVRIGLSNISSPFIIIPVNTSVHIGTLKKQYILLKHNSLSINGHLSFKVWIERPGTIVHLETNDNTTLDIQLYPGEVALNWNGQTYSCFSRKIFTKEWLSFEANIMNDPQTNDTSGLQVIIDNFHCTLNGSNFVNTWKKLANGGLSLGKPTVDNNTTIFRGYIENVTTRKNSPPSTINLQSGIDQHRITTLQQGVPSVSPPEESGCSLPSKPTPSHSNQTISTPSNNRTITTSSNKSYPKPSPPTRPKFTNEKLVPKQSAPSTNHTILKLANDMSKYKNMFIASYAIAGGVIIAVMGALLVAISWLIVKIIAMKRRNSNVLLPASSLKKMAALEDLS